MTISKQLTWQDSRQEDTPDGSFQERYSASSHRSTLKTEQEKSAKFFAFRNGWQGRRNINYGGGRRERETPRQGTWDGSIGKQTFSLRAYSYLATFYSHKGHLQIQKTANNRTCTLCRTSLAARAVFVIRTYGIGLVNNVSGLLSYRFHPHRFETEKDSHSEHSFLSITALKSKLQKLSSSDTRPPEILRTGAAAAAVIFFRSGVGD